MNVSTIIVLQQNTFACVKRSKAAMDSIIEDSPKCTSNHGAVNREEWTYPIVPNSSE